MLFAIIIIIILWLSGSATFCLSGRPLGAILMAAGLSESCHSPAVGDRRRGRRNNGLVVIIII